METLTQSPPTARPAVGSAAGAQIDEALDVSVILPAFNEEAAVGADLDDVRAAMESTGYRYEILVVDDGSTDATASLVRDRPWARLIQHGFNRGNGAARTTGVRAAKGRVIVFTDADRTYPNDRMPEMLRMIDAGADMVIGARRTEAGTLRWLRIPAKEFMRRLAEYMTGSTIPDLNSGLRAQKRDATLRFLPLLPTSHSWVSTVTLAFLATGYSVQWLSVDYYPRVGRSTFQPIRDTYNYLTLIIRAVMYFNPLKIFLPAALGLMGLAVVKYVAFDILWRHGWPPPFVPPLSTTSLALFIAGLQTAVIGLLADLIVRRTRV